MRSVIRRFTARDQRCLITVVVTKQRMYVNCLYLPSERSEWRRLCVHSVSVCVCVQRHDVIIIINQFFITPEGSTCRNTQ